MPSTLLLEPLPMPEEFDLSRLVERAARGEPGAADELAQAVHAELRDIAQAMLGSERAGHTLQPTALANEAWMRLQARFGRDAEWADRRAFFGAAAQAMRRLLVDHARQRGRAKRGGGRERVELDLSVHGFGAAMPDPQDVLDLDEALEALAGVNARAARVVELHIFGGLSQPEVAKELGVSLGTIELDWRSARVWLRERLERGGHGA